MDGESLPQQLRAQAIEAVRASRCNRVKLAVTDIDGLLRGKVIHADAAALAPLYPRMADFRACALRSDPEGKFRNAYLDKHVFC